MCTKLIDEIFTLLVLLDSYRIYILSDYFLEYKNAMCFLFTNLIAYDAVLQMVKMSLSIANATSNGAIINEMYYLFRIFNSVQLIDQ